MLPMLASCIQVRCFPYSISLLNEAKRVFHMKVVRSEGGLERPALL